MIGAASQHMISAKRVWRTTLKTAGRPPGDQKAGNGQAAGKQWEAAGRLFEQ